MIYFVFGYFIGGYLEPFRNFFKKPAQPERRTLCRTSYNQGLRDAGEILRDIRVECGISVGDNPIIEEALDRIRKSWK